MKELDNHMCRIDFTSVENRRCLCRKENMEHWVSVHYLSFNSLKASCLILSHFISKMLYSPFLGLHNPASSISWGAGDLRSIFNRRIEFAASRPIANRNIGWCFIRTQLTRITDWCQRIATFHWQWCFLTGSFSFLFWPIWRAIFPSCIRIPLMMDFRV